MPLIGEPHDVLDHHLALLTVLDEIIPTGRWYALAAWLIVLNTGTSRERALRHCPRIVLLRSVAAHRCSIWSPCRTTTTPTDPSPGPSIYISPPSSSSRRLSPLGHPRHIYSMSRSRHHKHTSFQRCSTIVLDLDLPCNKPTAKPFPRCRQHQYEFIRSIQEYKAYAELARIIAPSASITLDSVQRLWSVDHITDHWEIVCKHYDALYQEQCGRIMHRYRFFSQGMCILARVQNRLP